METLFTRALLSMAGTFGFIVFLALAIAAAVGTL